MDERLKIKIKKSAAVCAQAKAEHIGGAEPCVWRVCAIARHHERLKFKGFAFVSETETGIDCAFNFVVGADIGIVHENNMFGEIARKGAKFADGSVDGACWSAECGVVEDGIDAVRKEIFDALEGEKRVGCVRSAVVENETKTGTVRDVFDAHELGGKIGNGRDRLFIHEVDIGKMFEGQEVRRIDGEQRGFERGAQVVFPDICAGNAGKTSEMFGRKIEGSAFVCAEIIVQQNFVQTENMVGVQVRNVDGAERSRINAGFMQRQRTQGAAIDKPALTVDGNNGAGLIIDGGF